jgi:hypothetical protein
MVQPDTGEFGGYYLPTVLDFTYDAGFDLRLSSPRQPGHGFLSLVNARQRRQFIPQGAISFVEIAVAFVDIFWHSDKTSSPVNIEFRNPYI